MRRRFGLAIALLGSALAIAGLPALGADEPADPLAQADRAYHRGDLPAAIRLYRVAADAGNAAAQARLGNILDQAEENEEAVTWFRRAADQGNADGLHGLAQMHASGEGVPRSPTEALRCWNEAAKRGHVNATLVLARTYEAGWGDLKPDAALALRHWLRAAELGDASAMQRLAAVYCKGELGTAPDPARADAWEARLPKDPRR